HFARPGNESAMRAALSLVGGPSHNASNNSALSAFGARVEDQMSDKIYEIPAEWHRRALLDDAQYQEMYGRSIKDPNGFWAAEAKRIDWIKPFSKVKNTSYAPDNVSIKWFEDGTLN